jgi:hypothetical protein
VNPKTGKMDVEIGDLMLKEFFAQRYGWKPQEIDNMPWSIVEKFAIIISGSEKRKQYEMNKIGSKKGGK